MNEYTLFILRCNSTKWIQAELEVLHRYQLAAKYNRLRRELGIDVSAMLDMWEKVQAQKTNSPLVLRAGKENRRETLHSAATMVESPYAG